MRKLSLLIAFAGLAALVCAPGSALGLPGLPGVHVHLPEPDEAAYFDVVVEGKAVDTLTTEMSGESGPCLVTENGTVVDTTTYLRGRGVTVEFSRYGHKIIVSRVGRIGDSSLATKVEEKRTATGGSQFAPAAAGLPCSVPSYEFASNGDCGKTFASSGDLFFSYTARGLGLEVTSSTKRKQGFGSPNRCGEDPQTGINEPFQLAWPTQPKLEPAPSVTAKELFGNRQVIVALLRNSDVGKPAKLKTHLGIAPLTGSEEESATNQATVWLIRVPAP